MNYNPYAPPQAAPPNVSPPQPGQGPPQPWEIGEVVNSAFEAFKANWVVLVFGPLVVGFIVMVPAMVPGLLLIAGALEMGSAPYWAVYSVSMLVTYLLEAFFYVGLYRLSLAAARGERPDFGMIFTGADRFLPMFGTAVLFFLITGFGSVLLIVPGVILWLGLFPSLFFVVDQNMGPIDALKASWSATEGHKAHIFLFGLLSVAMMFGGLMACGVGMLAVVAILSVAMAIIYLRISGRGGPAPAFGMQLGYPGQPYAQGYGPPPGGYGPQGGGYGSPPQGGYGGPQGGYGGPQGGYGGPQGGGGGQGGPPPGGYGPPGGYNPGGGGGYGPPGGGGPPPKG